MSATCVLTKVSPHVSKPRTEHVGTVLLARPQRPHAARVAEEVSARAQSAQLFHPPLLGSAVLEPHLKQTDFPLVIGMCQYSSLLAAAH